jgi:hypothetical protein
MVGQKRPRAGGFGRFQKKNSDFAPDFQNPDFCPRLCARLWRRVQERWAKNRGSTAKHGPRKPSVRDCAGFWRAAMAWSVCGGGVRPPWSRKKTLAPDFFGQPSKTERSTEKRREKPKMRTENAKLLLQTLTIRRQTLTIRRQTLAPKRGSGCNIFMKSPEPPCRGF